MLGVVENMADMLIPLDQLGRRDDDDLNDSGRVAYQQGGCRCDETHLGEDSTSLSRALGS